MLEKILRRNQQLLPVIKHMKLQMKRRHSRIFYNLHLDPNKLTLLVPPRQESHRSHCLHHVNLEENSPTHLSTNHSQTPKPIVLFLSLANIVFKDLKKRY